MRFSQENFLQGFAGDFSRFSQENFLQDFPAIFSAGNSARQYAPPKKVRRFFIRSTRNFRFILKKIVKFLMYCQKVSLSIPNFAEKIPLAAGEWLQDIDTDRYT